MACNSSTCNSSGCYKGYEEEEQPKPNTKAAVNGGNSCQNLCVKCKVNEPVCCGIGGENSRFCKDCFKNNLYGKFKQAVTYNAMITPPDKVLVAFSGGPSSRVVLQFVHEMQYKAQKNYDANKDKSLPVFGVGVAFIDESSTHSFTSQHIEKAIEDIRLIVSNLAPPSKELFVVPIESIFSSDGIDGKERLKELLDAVSDVTGKEDLLIRLRILLLQKIASENGYTRIVLGSCTSRIACHVISATVKGQGYSLSADIQYVDSRWEIPVVLPLRDCPAQELNTLCSLDGSLKIVELLNGPCSGINGLVSSFVKVLQEENPSRECTIVRTAGKLTPFHFNRVPEIHDSNVPSATRRHQKRYTLKPNGSLSSDSFCPICNSPLKKSNFPSSLRSHGNQQNPDLIASACSSCQFQILPKDPSLMEEFLSLLPQQMITKAKHGDQGNFSLLREQIQEFLFSDGENEI